MYLHVPVSTLLAGGHCTRYDNRNTKQRRAVHAAIAQSCFSAGCQLVGIQLLAPVCAVERARNNSTNWFLVVRRARSPRSGGLNGDRDGRLPHPEHPRLVLILGLINMLFYVTAALRIKLIKHRT